MKFFLRNNSALFFLFLLALITALFFIFGFDRNALHLRINQSVGNPLLDTFFFYLTYLGDGAAATLILLAILIYNVRLGLYATSSFLTATLFSIFLKKVFFDDSNRPFFIFNYIDKHTLNLVKGVDMHIHNSFPSGHATQAFSILICLAFFSSKNYMKFIFLILALLTSFSRVYLSQHWLVDVTAGSCIGFTFSVIYYFVFIANNKLEHFNTTLFNFRKA